MCHAGNRLKKFKGSLICNSAITIPPSMDAADVAVGTRNSNEQTMSNMTNTIWPVITKSTPDLLSTNPVQIVPMGT